MNLHALLPVIPAETPAGWYYVCVGGAVLITGISKAGFGGGVGILAIPLMALVMGPRHMLGVMLPLLVACDVFSNLHYIGEYDWKKLRLLLPGLIGGIVVGTLILWRMGNMPPDQFNRIMSGVVGAICLAIVLLQAYRLTGRDVPTLPPHPVSALSVGGVAGAVSTLNHGAGPIVQIYLMQEKLDKRRLVGTLLFYFLIGNAAKLPTYATLKIGGETLINLTTLRDSIWFIPLIPVGTLAGAWMHKRVPEKPFAAIMYIAAGVSALQMVAKAMNWSLPTPLVFATGAAVLLSIIGVIVWARFDREAAAAVPAGESCAACGHGLAATLAAGGDACPECGALVTPD